MTIELQTPKERLEACIAPMPKLTAAQQRILDRVRERGIVRFNGRRAKAVHTLRDLGLVIFTLEVEPNCGRSPQLFYSVTATPTRFVRYDPKGKP